MTIILFAFAFLIPFFPGVVVGYTWVAQNIYGDNTCSSTTLNEMYLFQMNHCFQTGPSTSYIESCYNTTSGTMVRTTTTYTGSGVCNGLSTTAQSKYSTGCVGKISYSCLTDPEAEQYSGIGFWSTNSASKSNCAKQYGPLYIVASPPGCLGTSATSWDTSCVGGVATAGTITRQNFNTANCSSNPSSSPQTMTTNQCNYLPATDVDPSSFAYANCQILL